MRCLTFIVVFAVAGGLAGAQETQTFYLKQMLGPGLPDLLDGLVSAHSPWVEGLEKHWARLKPSLVAPQGMTLLRASGSHEALEALAKVVAALDVPRPTVTVRYRHVRVADPETLLGRALSPPMPNPLAGASQAKPLSVRVAVGDWDSRIGQLLEAKTLEVLHEGETRSVDGIPTTIYVGDPGAVAPEFRLAFCPVMVTDGATSLSASFGRFTRRGATGGQARSGADGHDGPVCACARGLGETELIPELTVTVRVPPGQSVLIGSAKWHVEGEDAALPDGEFVLLTPRAQAAPGG